MKPLAESRLKAALPVSSGFQNPGQSILTSCIFIFRTLLVTSYCWQDCSICLCDFVDVCSSPPSLGALWDIQEHGAGTGSVLVTREARDVP